MSRRFLLLVVATTYVLGGSALARADQSSPLAWKDAVKIAAEKNPVLRSAKKEAEANLARYRESFNGILPSLNLSSSYVDSQDANASDNRWRAAADASWDIFDLNKISNISSANAALNKARAAYNVTSANVRQSLFQAFAGVLYQQEVVYVNETILSIRSNNARMVSLRYDSGRESKGNRMASDAELLQAQTDVNQSKRDARAAQQELDHQLGRDRYQAVETTGTLDGSIPAEPDFDALVDRHPLVAQSQADVESAQAAVKAAKSQVFPTLTANYSRSFSGHDFFPGNPTWTASGVLSFPIIGKGPTSTFYLIRASLDARASAEATLAETRAQVRSNLESAWSNLQRAVDQVKVQEAFLKASRQQNSESDVRYTSGLMTYEDWARIVTDRVSRESSAIQAHRDAALAEAAWRQAEGIGLEDDL